MKKTISFILSFMLMATHVFAYNNISVYLNNKEISFEQPPIIRDDSTLVPFRAIFEELDTVVQWFGEEKRVTAEKDGISITLFIGEKYMIVNDATVELNTPPIIYNDYTLVPLRAVSQAANAEVDWDGDNGSVYITLDKTSEDWGREVLNLVNEIRKEYDLSPLAWDNSLAAAAEDYCRDMIERDFFSHVTPDGKTLFDRMADCEIVYSVIGENIAAGQHSPSDVVDAWMNSAGHRKNILNPYFEYLGVGVVRGGSYGIYWTQEFANFN